MASPGTSFSWFSFVLIAGFAFACDDKVEGRRAAGGLNVEGGDENIDEGKRVEICGCRL